jgi:ATP-dependent helicase HrpB
VRHTTTLPIDEIIPSLRAALAARTVAVLEAPPGAGKTTRVPLALMAEPWLGGAKLVMLEPRRLAARAAASFMASILGEEVGQTVGYRVRGETRISTRTRIEVVTEGVLARMLSSDAALEDIGLVIFDEFHERSLHADLGLALVLETQRHLRDELRVLVMSATLDGVAVSALLADVRRDVQGNQERLAAITAELGRTQIRAPVDGQVVGLTMSGVGGVVSAGQRLMEIVPIGEPLLLDAKVPYLELLCMYAKRSLLREELGLPPVGGQTPPR